MNEDLARKIGEWLTRTGRWARGMVTANGSRLIGRDLALDGSPGEYIWADPSREGGMTRWVWLSNMTVDGWAPKLDDPATWGPLLAILWERWPRAELACCGTEGGGTGYRIVKSFGAPPWRGPWERGGPGIAIARALCVAYADEMETP